METLLEDFISDEDLKTCEKLYNDELRRGIRNPKTKFDYAWCLIRSRYPADTRKGVLFMEDLFKNGDESARRDYVYYLAFGKCKLKEYSSANRYIKAFLEIEPSNRQAKELQEVIQKRITREGLAGAAIAGGIVAVVVGTAFALLKK
ncbi:mitochondrial fission 1 protein [Galendromus occidentalis]|uniref:Mitochondrial fission 1 protein n=1 Tax=Galendromus occidentalis TaxID=34638 RepID=A0AAJ6QKM7_9ACAR|nr:mitochondrial fission 1 protein [Galendromus occidentalis]